MKIILKTPMFLNGHRYSHGDVVDLPPGVEGPYNGSEPAFDIIDDESWNERADLTAKHAKEREELESPDRKRAALMAKQAEESADLRRKHAEKALARRHEREKSELEAQHKGQAEALKHRPSEQIVAPRETNEADLGERHKYEDSDLAKRQEAEKKALEDENKAANERKAVADKARQVPSSDRAGLEAPTMADEHKAVSQGQMAD